MEGRRSNFVTSVHAFQGGSESSGISARVSKQDLPTRRLALEALLNSSKSSNASVRQIRAGLKPRGGWPRGCSSMNAIQTQQTNRVYQSSGAARDTPLYSTCSQRQGPGSTVVRRASNGALCGHESSASAALMSPVIGFSRISLEQAGWSEGMRGFY